MGTTEPAAAAPTVGVVVEVFDVDAVVAVGVGVVVVVSGFVESLSEDDPEEGVGGLALIVVVVIVVDLTVGEVVVDTVEILSAKALAICAATRAQS